VYARQKVQTDCSIRTDGDGASDERTEREKEIGRQTHSAYGNKRRGLAVRVAGRLSR